MALIFGGEPIDTRAHVIDWRSHGLKFELGTNSSVGRRKAPPRLLIVHYSGGENPPPTIYKTLRERNLSCEFAMDLHGMIWQFADPTEVFCGHCQGMNKVSFGIEIQSRGLADAPSAFYRRSWQKWDVEVPRGRYRALLSTAAPASTNEVSYASFTAEQLTALVDFIDGFIDADIIPRTIPRAYYTRFGLNTKKMQGLQGVAGHYHFDADKFDPGPQVFEELEAEGFKKVAP